MASHEESHQPVPHLVDPCREEREGKEQRAAEGDEGGDDEVRGHREEERASRAWPHRCMIAQRRHARPWGRRLWLGGGGLPAASGEADVRFPLADALCG